MDIIELFDEYDVQYWKTGKNISRGWIGLQCPFCDDNSNHLGIRTKDFKCRCWKCGWKKLTTVLKEVLNIDYNQAVLYSKQLDPSGDSDYKETGGIDVIKNKLTIKLPEEIEKKFPEAHKKYLRDRGFPVAKTIRDFQLKAVNHLGRYKFRIIIPIIYQKRIISFTSRDITGLSEYRYLAAPKNTYPNPKHFVYNIDSVKTGGQAILVEGPTDVWRLGEGAISFFGTTYDSKQLVHIVRKKISRLHIFFDNDRPGIKTAAELSRAVRSLVKEVNIIKTDAAADPGSMTREQGEIVMRTLGMR